MYVYTGSYVACTNILPQLLGYLVSMSTIPMFLTPIYDNIWLRFDVII